MIPLNELLSMAREAGAGVFDLKKSGMKPFVLMTFDDLERFANLVAAHEREACAKIVEASPSYDWHRFACEAAAAIRERGE